MNYKILVELGEKWDLLNISVRRASLGCALDLELKYIHEGNEIRVKLYKCKDVSILESLLEADRVCISKEKGSQREFGTIHVECFEEEFYSEYWCDSAEVI